MALLKYSETACWASSFSTLPSLPRAACAVICSYHHPRRTWSIDYPLLYSLLVLLYCLSAWPPLSHCGLNCSGWIDIIWKTLTVLKQGCHTVKPVFYFSLLNTEVARDLLWFMRVTVGSYYNQLYIHCQLHVPSRTPGASSLQEIFLHLYHRHLSKIVISVPVYPG